MTNENPWGGGENSGLDKIVNDFKQAFARSSKTGQKNSGPGGLGLSKLFFILIPVLVVFLIFKSFYQIQAGEKGIILKFGKYSKTTNSGLNFLLPFVEEVIVVDVETIRKEEFGFRSSSVQRGFPDASRSTRTLDVESLILTGDRNVINLNWVVQYKISNPKDFVFNIKDGRATIRDLSEMVIRRLAGNRDFDYLLDQREELALETKIEMQEKLNSYSSGVDLVAVQLQDVTPPEAVRPSFNEVNEADQDKTRLVNEAQKIYNEKIPKARGNAKKDIAEAEGYAIQRINEAVGDTIKFNALLREYRKYKIVTKTRLYIEAMKNILPNVSEVTVIDQESQIFPLYNINKDQK